VAGIIIAIVVLAPESITAVRAALNNALQKSLNLALGSSLATIGLTIPAVAITNIFIGKQIEIGLSARDTLLLTLTLFLSLLTFGTGRTNILTGFVHIVVFTTFLFLVFLPSRQATAFNLSAPGAAILPDRNNLVAAFAFRRRARFASLCTGNHRAARARTGNCGRNRHM